MANAACNEHTKVAATLSMSLCAISKHQTANTKHPSATAAPTSSSSSPRPTAQLRTLLEIYAKTIKK